MEFRTVVDVEDPGFRIEPCEEMLFVGSCFADNIGARFKAEKFRATVNPFGVMYNPASILHTVERLSLAEPSILGSLRTAFFTLGTNPESVEALTRLIDDLCLGYKLPGAGGGGYLYMIAKDPEAAARIKQILTDNSPRKNARFVEMDLSTKGLQISRS